MAELRTPFRRSPLNHRPPIEGNAGTVRMAEAPFLGKFILRVDPQAGAEKVHTALGIELPVEPLTAAGAGDTSLLWMGPDEWMLVTAEEKASELSGALRNALAGLHHQLVDVGDYYTAVDIAGPKTRELLMKLTTLDLHPRSFRAGATTGGVFGRANATLWQMTDDKEPGGPGFRLFVRWSMADYLWCALTASGREWGVAEQAPVKGETLVVGH